jgi:ribose transport system ATP-binding protein
VPYLLFGSPDATGGTLELSGEVLQVTHLTPARCVAKRIALVPADRQLLGLSAPLSVWENLTMLVEDDHFRQGVFHRRELVAIAEQAIVEFAVRPPRADVAAGTLSGGNQQKVVVAKWLLAKPRLLVLHEPTQGVDVGARRDIYHFVKAAAAEGMAVVWVTTEFGELAEVCDRVLVVSQGRQTAELTGEALDGNEITAAVLRQFEEVR